MAVQVGSLYVSLKMDTRPYGQGWANARSVTTQAVGQINREVGLAQRSVNSFTSAAGNRNFHPYALLAASRGFETAADRASLLRSSLLSVTALAGGFGAALGTNVVARYADTFINLNNQLKTVTSSSSNLEAVQEKLAGVARRSRSSLQSTATIYARTARATETLGLSQEKLLSITETVQKAFAIGGATSAEAQGAAIQLSQGIASDRFSGEEFRSVAENAPVLLRGMAESLNVNIGKLREMAHAGELTADVVTQAILKSGSRIESEFGQTAITVDRALTQVDNSLLLYIGNADKAYGVTSAMTSGLLAFGDNLDSIIPTLTRVAGAIGAVFLARKKGLIGGGLGALLGGAAGLSVGGLDGAAVGAGLGGLLGNNAAKGREIQERGPDGSIQSRRIGFIEAIRRESAAANLEVARLTQQQVDLRRETIVAGTAAARARQAASGDLLKQAPASFGAAYQRELLQVQKLDEDRLRLNDKISDSYRKLSAVTAQMTPKAVKLAQAQIEAEERLSATLARQQTLRGARTQALTKETAVLGMQVTAVNKMSAVTSAVKERIAVEKELGRVQAQVGRETEAVARRSVEVATTASAADSKAAKERIAVQRELRSHLEETARLDDARRQQTNVLSGTRGQGEAAGALAAKGKVAETTAAYRASSAALAQTTAQLGAATQAATKFGLAKAFVGRQVSSIIGLFGGPWGVAITGAIGLLSILGTRALEEAQRISNARQLINSELAKIGQGTSGGSADATISLQVTQADKLKGEIAQITAQVEDAKKKLAEFTSTNTNNSRGPGTSSLFRTQTTEIAGLTQAYIDGRLTINEYDAAVKSVTDRFQSGVLDEIAAQFRAAGVDISGGTLALDSMNAQMQDLLDSASDPHLKTLLGSFDALNKQGLNPDLINALADTAKLKAFSAELDKQNQLLLLSSDERSRAAVEQKLLNAAQEAGLGNIDGLDAMISKWADQQVAISETAAEADKFDQGIKKLEEQVSDLNIDNLTKGLDPFNQQVVKTAREMGISNAEIEKFIYGLRNIDTSGLVGVSSEFARIIALVKQLLALQAQVGKVSVKTDYIVPSDSSPSGSKTVSVYRPPATGDDGSSAPSGGFSNTLYPDSGVSVIKPMATGGDVRGAGTGTSDSILSWLSNGEYVVNARSAKRHRGLLEMINSAPSFAVGGLAHSGPVNKESAAAYRDWVEEFLNPEPRTSGTGFFRNPPPIPKNPGSALSNDRFAELLRNAGQGQDISGLEGFIEYLGSSHEGNKRTTSFKRSLAPRGKTGDRGLDAFDAANPDFAARMESVRHNNWGGTRLWDLYEQFRLNHGEFFYLPSNAIGSSRQMAAALAYAKGKGANPGELFNNTSQNPFSNAQGFSTGGAILPGPDSQNVMFRKRPDEAVAIFTPEQRAAVGNAITAGGESRTGDINVNVYFKGDSNEPDGRLRQKSRAELKAATTAGVLEALGR